MVGRFLRETKFNLGFQKYQKENNLAALAMCKKRSSAVIVPEKPGRMAYDRNTDPNYNKCRSKVLYDDNQ